ncbi:hypothetical protein RQP53_10605 [Paucibacter sp. APW11]|uniref:Uncharacterized protein n=1 Tax=Roseateles aquae TaxID=3077235 RepID=A0ABU3PAV5_9BURK|nr:hypothetical protein [Paucibacter sp. APW11]MDT8999717.1 hypothetical protein [Paucibacter sp. APW11]
MRIVQALGIVDATGSDITGLAAVQQPRHAIRLPRFRAGPAAIAWARRLFGTAMTPVCTPA